MNLEDMVEKIKRLENGNGGTNIVCFIVALDFLYFIKDNEQRERFIKEYYKNDNIMFTTNFKKICTYCESILIEDGIYDNMLKSIEVNIDRTMLVSLYNYYDTIDIIEKTNNSPKEMISDGFKIRLLKKCFDSSNEAYDSLDKKVNTLNTRYERNIIDIVTIISIFIAISIGMVSGISFSLQAFSNFTNGNFIKISLITLVVGFVILNLFFALFKFVSKIVDKKFDDKGYIIWIDLVFVFLIALFLVLSVKC